ncbi:MAG: hypothetical protein AAB451_04035 [Patescibacteria group bacterium]
MNKKTLVIIIAIVSIITLSVGGYFYWHKKNISKKTETASPAEKIIDNAVKGVLPSLGTSPLENKPDINPADKANPYKNIKTNPF